MNITHFVENLDRGGLERMVLELVKLQQRQGHRCQVVCLFEPGSQAHELRELGIPVNACDKRQGLDLRALARARASIRSHNTEVLHTHNAVAHYQAVLATCGLPMRQVINTRHGMGGLRRAERREWLYRRALGRTHAIVAVCEAARNDAVQRGIVPPEKTCVVPNGIRVERFQTASASMRRQLLQSLGLPSITRLIGNVGRLNWAKDQATLIRAFGHVHASEPDTALLLIGEGELRTELQRCVDELGLGGHVHFLGDRNDVQALLAGLDLFVLSSVSEGYSLALLEAGAAALPVIATDVGGNREIIRDGRTGRLVKASDVAALSEVMLDLLHHPAHALALGLAARAWVEQHGSLDAMACSYAELYQGSKTVRRQ